MNKCAWCGKESEDLKKISINAHNWGKETVYICSDNCQHNLEKYMNYVMRNLKYFILGMFGFILLGIAFCIKDLIEKNESSLGILSMLGGVGLTLVIFPFTTPHTISKRGVKQGIRSSRILGVIIIAIAVFLCFSVR